MFVTTPERLRPVLPSVASLSRTTPRVLLPPLLEILSETTPYRHTLPSIDSLDTPFAKSRQSMDESRNGSNPYRNDVSSTPVHRRGNQTMNASIVNTSVNTVVNTVMSTPSVTRMSTSAGYYPNTPMSKISRTPNTMPVSRQKPSLMVQTKQISPSHSTGANTSMESDADVSINDLMAKVSKRKASNTSPSRDFAFISHSPATYPSQEPSIDNALLARRKRRRTSPHELAILNLEFLLGSTPNKVRRGEIAAKVNMSEKAVQIWFQNRRQALRRFKAADREVTELPPTPDSSMSAIVPENGPTPLHESTPIKPPPVKVHLQLFDFPPTHAPQASPLRSYSTSNLPHRSDRPSVLSKILASDSRRDLELVLSLTNKKQPEFARQSPVAATQVRTFKLAPKDRRPLAEVNTNVPSCAKKASELQCVHGLLSLREGNY